MGTNGGNPNPIFGNTILDFNEFPVAVRKENLGMNFSITSVAMSDEDGRLLFYTDNTAVFDASYRPMDGSDGFNPGVYTSERITGGKGYKTPQPVIAIRHPGAPQKYYLIHTSITRSLHPPYAFTDVIYYSIIDMRLNGGLGSMIVKNKVLQRGIFGDGLSACRHANGRDWWILAHAHQSNQFYLFMLDPGGIRLQHTQRIGFNTQAKYDCSTFTPDGSKYISNDLGHWTTADSLSIFDFDRCDGMLMNPRQFYYGDTANYSGGVAVSPNNRYLYVSHNTYVLQYDLFAPDIEATKCTVAVYDGYLDTISATLRLPTNFLLARLAPDSRIYINSSNSVKKMHVIYQPDLPGLACNLRQHDLSLAALNTFTMPYYPNYRLGALEGSICDTLLSSIDIPKREIPGYPVVYPNPATEWLRIAWSGDSKRWYEFVAHDINGSVVLTTKLPPGVESSPILINHLKPGLYYWQIWTQEYPAMTGKFIKIE